MGGIRKSYFNRALLVGDAAGQVKPWSGGGVVYGLTCAGIASETIREAFMKNDLGEGSLEAYERLWKRRIGKNITLGMAGRKLLKTMNNGMLDMLFRIAGKIDLNWLDMDFVLNKPGRK